MDGEEEILARDLGCLRMDPAPGDPLMPAPVPPRPQLVAHKLTMQERLKKLPYRRCPQATYLSRFVDQRVRTRLNGGRAVEGVLRGFDPFLNLVVDEATELRRDGRRIPIGCVVMRGSSIIMVEAIDSLT